MSARSPLRALLPAGLLATCLVAQQSASPTPPPTPPPAALWVASDGAGAIDVLWSPLADWPGGGFRLERLAASGSEIIAPRLLPAPELAAGVSEADRELVRRLALELPSGGGDAAASAFLRGILVPELGRAAGLRARENGQRGVRRYRLSGLAADGRELWRVESEAVDPGVATPLALRPLGLTATQDEAGLLLEWDPAVEEERALPAFAFAVERAAGPAAFAPLTSEPRISLLGVDATRHGFRDPAPPVGEARYRLRWVDVFGRAGETAEIAVTLRDLAALRPPSQVAAEAAEGGSVTVRWKLNPSPGTTGYRVERSTLAGGPWNDAVADALPRSATSWTDREVQVGTAYFYRLRSLTRDDGAGDPSAVAAAVARSARPPATPDGLTAEAGRTRVRLTWTPTAGPVAGYLVERRTAAGTWARLDGDLSNEALFDDSLGEQDGGTLAYRVTAVGYDSRQSAPSRVLEVTIPDTVAPDPPRLLGIDGSGGRVALRFTAGAPAAATHHFLLLRAGSADDPPLVVGEPLPAGTAETVDRFVLAGDVYVYRLVAVDAAGNRSELSAPMRVLVESPPAPVAPRLEASWQAKPFPHVRLRFAAPPAGCSAVAQRRLGATGDWLQIAEPTAATEILDVRVPREAENVAYRLLLRDANGVESEPSAAVSVEIARD